MFAFKKYNLSFHTILLLGNISKICEKQNSNSFGIAFLK